MKKHAFKFLTLIALTIVIVSCKDKADEAKTTAVEDASKAKATSVKHMVNPTESIIEWTGFKPTGKHNGTIKVESGVFTEIDYIIPVPLHKKKLRKRKSHTDTIEKMKHLK